MSALEEVLYQSKKLILIPPSHLLYNLQGMHLALAFQGSGFTAFLILVRFVNLTQTRVTCEGGALRGIAFIRFGCAQVCEAFFLTNDWCGRALPTVAGDTLGLVVVPDIREQAEAPWLESQEAAFLQVSAPVPASRFLPWLSYLMDIWAVR